MVNVDIVLRVNPQRETARESLTIRLWSPIFPLGSHFLRALLIFVTA
ncbi:MAG: hypothetical protein HLUCCO16_02765 [Phormidium sp. OSCR]|nr:MAG: hypothetical protein HLUCCO16_02765 [Phormidium sp. OSCR]